MSDGTFRGRWIDEVLGTPHVSPEVKVLLWAMSRDMDEAGRVSVPRNDLAELLNCAPRNVTAKQKSAIDAGLIQRISRGHNGRTSTFAATLPGGREEAVKGDDRHHPTSGVGGRPSSPYGERRGTTTNTLRTEGRVTTVVTQPSGKGDDRHHPTDAPIYKDRAHAHSRGDRSGTTAAAEADDSRRGAVVVQLFDEEIEPSLRSQTPVRASAPASGEHPAFAEWYEAYPVHKARGAAVKAFAKAAKKTDPETLIAAAKRYRDDPQVIRGYAKHPATWLNQECWLDEPSTALAPQHPAHDPSGTDARVAGWAALAAQLDRNQP